MKASITLLLYCLYFLGNYFCIANESNEISALPASTPAQAHTSNFPFTSSEKPQPTTEPKEKPTSTPCPTPSTTTCPAVISFPIYFIAGVALILVSTILLMSTLMLACKVCQLSRRLQILSGHSELMTTAKSWKECSEKDNKSEADAKETIVLMSNLNEARDETGDGGDQPNVESVKEEKENVCENGVGHKENGAKNEEVKETSAAATGNSSSAQEEDPNSQTSEPEEAAATEDKKDAKDGE